MYQVPRREVKVKDLKAGWARLCDIEKDVHIAVSGDEGDGKSSFTYDTVVNELGGDPWNSIVFTKNPKEFYDKYDALEESKPMCFDEALAMMNRLDWANTTMKDLVYRFRGEIRKEKRAIFFYNVQLFRDLHGYWRTHRIRHWFELMPRHFFMPDAGSRAVYLERQRVPFITGTRDTWLLDEQEKVWLKGMASGPIFGEEYANMLRRHPFYRGEFRFYKLKPEEKAEYDKRRLEAKEIYEKPELPGDKPSRTDARIEAKNAQLAKMASMLKEKGVPFSHVAAQLGMNENTLHTILFKSREPNPL